MGITRKSLSLIFVILAVSSILIVESASAQSIPKPSVPEFTVKYADHSYDVPSTHGIDSYTGHNVTIQEGYHIQNKSMEVIIKNQPFTPYKDGNGNTLELWYDVRWKGHFGNYWQDTNRSTYLVASNCISIQNGNNVQLLNPNALSSIVSIGFSKNNGSSYTSNDDYAFYMGDISSGGEVDFQVQAFIGYYTQEPISYQYPRFMDQPTYYNIFHGESSGWSNTQTITIPETSTSTSPNPTPTPTIPEFPILVILPLFGAIFLILTKLLRKKQPFLKAYN